MFRLKMGQLSKEKMARANRGSSATDSGHSFDPPTFEDRLNYFNRSDIDQDADIKLTVVVPGAQVIEIWTSPDEERVVC